MVSYQGDDQVHTSTEPEQYGIYIEHNFINCLFVNYSSNKMDGSETLLWVLVISVYHGIILLYHLLTYHLAFSIKSSNFLFEHSSK